MSERHPGLPDEPFWRLDRVISFGIAMVYGVVIYKADKGNLAGFAILVIGSLVCIWFPDIIGDATGTITGRPAITKGTPEKIVYFAGWAMLLFPVWGAIIATLLK
jgi:hypothetical protein